jgi:hypothetical protein
VRRTETCSNIDTVDYARTNVIGSGSVATINIKSFPIGLHVMYLYSPDTPPTYVPEIRSCVTRLNKTAGPAETLHFDCFPILFVTQCGIYQNHLIRETLTQVSISSWLVAVPAKCRQPAMLPSGRPSKDNRANARLAAMCVTKILAMYRQYSIT